MSNAMKTPSIEPGDIGGQGSPFLLSKSEWYAIQRYVSAGVMLPITEEEFKDSLGGTLLDDISEFQSLLDAYGDIKTNCTNWRDNIFPESVSLASDIYNYGKNLAPTYYPPINTLADMLDENPNDEKAKKKLKALLEKLKGEAQTRADKAAAVAKKVKDFSNITQDSKNVLAGEDGLNQRYEEKYGSTSQEVQDIQKEIKDINKLLEQLNKEYDKNVILASTTPTYLAIPVIGWIAAPIVAGVFGDLAVKTMNRIRAQQAKIASLSEDLRMRTNLMTTIYKADIGLDNIITDIEAALPIIQKIQGIWGAISDDIGNIVSLIDNNIDKVIPLLKSLGVDAAVEAWRNVAEEANNYRVNAYIKIEGEGKSDS